ncbi:serine/threonine-protein kinase [Actinomadura montaniterrae]|uniref:non-specific serine/threonine protein kinase n=1 Tax=Actinomadura montaniterrae TaxID=1803903 RepID=A0A6L3VKD0_9ACTN|nr:serine/threonine-protein kinase [Actinomadura montaniterrae]KAB2371662.1 serine/threonine protein kinase [Actinomadura montaniterrae]
MNGDRPLPLARRYRLLSVVGRGGMGTVWRAYDEMLDRDVAVKEVRLPGRITEAERRALCRRLLAEARATAALRHPGVAAVHDVLVEGGRPWIVMEFLPACSLNRLVGEGGPLGVRRTARIGAAVLSVLRAAHDAGILHRDVKPSNVLVCDDGRVLLTDFGLALHTDRGRGPGGPLQAETMAAGIEGSPAYLAPERVHGLPSVEASDLWSLGATLYTAVEGFSPFLRCHALASMVAVLLGDYARPVRAGALTPVIEGLLRERPEDRLSAEAAARMLQEVADAEPAGATAAVLVPAPKPRRPRPAPRPSRSGVARVRRTLRVPVLVGRRLRPGAVLSVAVLAVVAAGVGTWTARWNSVGKSDSVALRPAAGVEAKMVKYTEEGAYSVRVPAGWQSERRDDVMEWEDRASGRGLRISPAPGGPLDGLRAAERRAVAKHRYPGYHRLRLEAAPDLGEDAAEWEFAWDGDGDDGEGGGGRGAGGSGGHGGEHVLCSRAAGYEFCFHAPEAHWTPGQRLYDRVLRTFRPRKG